MRLITAVLLHMRQTIGKDAENGTHPAAWQIPALVRAGTIDANDLAAIAQATIDAAYHCADFTTMKNNATLCIDDAGKYLRRCPSGRTAHEFPFVNGHRRHQFRRQRAL